jgi:methionine biosynthesis protein MetW
MARPSLLILIVAYFAEKTLAKVLARVPKSLSDTYDVEVLVIDDGSGDHTFNEGVRASRSVEAPFRVTVLHNPLNQGYGGNQKIGYHYAIENGFDFVALVHGDGQYAPECLPELLEPLRKGDADAVFGSRMMDRRSALRGGMPYYKYYGNRILTGIQNRLLGTNLSEFHSGYRLYSVAALKALPFDRNSNVFHFDTEIIIQLVMAGRRIVELPIPTYYGDEICYVNGMKYARDVVKATLQARFQRLNLFYDRRFDCEVQSAGSKYPSKLEFESTHSRILELIPEGASVLDLGSGLGAVGMALKQKNNCRVVGCDVTRGTLTGGYDRFVNADLNQGLPAFEGESFDYIIALDVIEHLSSPEDFLDELRRLASQTGAKVIVSTANVGFIVMRLSLLFGRFEYGKRGILDLTHTRLFTFATLRRAMTSAGFEIKQREGISVPLPFVFGPSRMARAAMAINRFLIRLSPKLFGFQMLFVAEPRPTLETLLARAVEASAARRAALAKTTNDAA